MDRAVCEACRVASATREIRDFQARLPYRLCDACARRLEKRALRPLEFFNLAAIHSAGTYALHDDFYDENGVAEQPQEPVTEPERYPAPTLAQVADDLPRLVDYALSRRCLQPETLDVLRAWPKDSLLAEVRSRVEPTCGEGVEIRAYDICAEVIGVAAADWVRTRWQTADREILFLTPVIGRCLPEDEAFALIAAEVEAGTASVGIRRFDALNSTRVLDWIEANLDRFPGPMIHAATWGQAAACNRMDWERAARWIAFGQPLSRIALHGLSVADTRPANLGEAVAALNNYLELDPVPAVRRLIATIQANWAPERIAV